MGIYALFRISRVDSIIKINETEKSDWIRGPHEPKSSERSINLYIYYLFVEIYLRSCIFYRIYFLLIIRTVRWRNI